MISKKGKNRISGGQDYRTGNGHSKQTALSTKLGKIPERFQTIRGGQGKGEEARPYLKEGSTGEKLTFR